MPSPTPRHRDIVFSIHLALRQYLKEYGIPGRSFSDVEFSLSDQLRLRPDVCALMAEKARQLDLDRSPIPGVPDLAIEVISPSERASDSYDKVQACLRNGTAEVWQFYPKSRTLQIHRAGTSTSVEADQELTSSLLPGFSALVSSFFE